MADAARASGRPRGVWAVGLMYQGLSLGWTFGMTVARPLVATLLPNSHWLQSPATEPFARPTTIFDPLVYLRRLHQDFGWLTVLIYVALALLIFRMVVGLARITHLRMENELAGEEALSLRTAWHAGRGEARGALGLWTQILLMMFLAALIFLGSTQFVVSMLTLGDHHPLRILLVGLSVGLVGIYGFVLSVLFQLALHSLAQNRRGVGSALLHAWRILRSDPAAAGRATVVDAVLFLTVLALQLGALLVVGAFEPLLDMARLAWVSKALTVGAVIMVLGLEAFAGCTRCAFWATAYRRLGGMSTAPSAVDLGRLQLEPDEGATTQP